MWKFRDHGEHNNFGITATKEKSKMVYVNILWTVELMLNN